MEKCKCFDIPPDGRFLKNKIYNYTYVIDGINVEDENNDLICFSELNWLWYFIKV